MTPEAARQRRRFWAGQVTTVIFAVEPKFPYRRVADDLRDKIKSGELAGQLPSLSKLAEEYGVADMTVGHALDVQKDEGLLYGIAGLGVLVRKR